MSKYEKINFTSFSIGFYIFLLIYLIIIADFVLEISKINYINLTINV